MRGIAVLCLVGFVLSACGDEVPFDTGPFASIPPTERLRDESLVAPVDVVRDVYGIPHIYAETIDDAMFVNGYVMARDRLPQMHLFRHVASGTVAELFGALAPEQIDTDIEMRMHGMRRLAEAAWAELQASNDPRDQDIVRALERFADGVNLYLAELQAGDRTLDDAVNVLFDPLRAEPWSPVDSLVIGRLQTWSLSYLDDELRLHRGHQRAAEVFPPNDARTAYARRAGAIHDLFPFRPMQTTATRDGFPNVDEDTGSRAKPAARRAAARRPRVPSELLSSALETLRRKRVFGLPLRQAGYASNNWIVGPALGGGGALLANDTHLPLTNPPIWWMVHITVPGELDVEGVTFPGAPGVLLGHNAHIAWGATVVAHDVVDFYDEEIHPCAAGDGDCVTWKGREVKVETWQETIGIGTLGTILEEKTVTLERVPHHGPLVPEIVDHDVVPRASSRALSVRFTGHEVTHEIRAFYGLNRAKTLEEAFEALAHYKHGGMNWVVVDDLGNIGWTTTANVPWRSPACYTWNRATNPDGLAPFFVAPGDGSCEWEGFLDERYLPHAVNPPEGFLASANADPVGQTFDGDPLNQPVVDGRPLYLGALYDPGFRVGRIVERLRELAAAGEGIDPEDMQSIQGDARSNFGARMRPHLLAAFERLSAGTAPGDAQAWYAALPAARKDRLEVARARLQAWTLATPAAVEGEPSAEEIADSVATAIFQIWTVFFLQTALGDELEAIGDTGHEYFTPRAALAMLERPGDLVTGLAPETGEPLLCDVLATSAVESCTLIALRALDEALTWATNEGFRTDDMNAWRWGKLHRLTLRPLFPLEELEVPTPDEPDPLLRKGFPRHGDEYCPDVGSSGLDDFDFTYESGPAMRHVTRFAPGASPRTFFALPGGQVFDRRSPHYRDLMDTYWRKNAYFEMPWSIPQILEKAEERWRFVR